MKTTCAKLCSIVALVVGAAGAAVAVTSVGLFIALGPGREAYTRLDAFLNWHAYLALAVVPFAVVALCLGRARPALLAFGLCCGSWGVTTVLVANSFHGDRPPPDYRSAPTAQQAPTANPAMASLFHAEYQCRGVAEVQRWAA
jgi:hypothetical protein